MLNISDYRLRGLAACLTGGAVLSVLRGSSAGGAGSAVPLPERTAVNFVSGVLYVAIVLPLAMRLQGKWQRRLAQVFLVLYVTGGLTDLIEAYFFTTLLSPFTLAAALVFEALPMLVIAAVVVRAMRSAAGDAIQRDDFRSWSLIPRLLLAGALYVPIYFGFASLVAPIEHQYYFDPGFVAQLQTRVPPDFIAIPLEAARGLLFALALLPALAVFPGRSWMTWVYIGLIGVVIEAWVPLLGQTAWPLGMRLGNAAELTGDGFGRAAVALALLGNPPLIGRWTHGDQATSIPLRS